MFLDNDFWLMQDGPVESIKLFRWAVGKAYRTRPFFDRYRIHGMYEVY